MKGTFKWYNKEKGYGFVTGEDSKDYFVHYSTLPQGQQDIRESDKIQVTFEVVETQRGTQAQNIVFEESSSEDDESFEDEEE